MTTAAFTTWLAEASAKTGADLLIILDRLRSIFSIPTMRDRITLPTRWSVRSTRPRCRANFMLSLREDGLARLDFFKGRIPFLLDNRLSVDRLSRAAAREAIERPLAQYYQDTGQRVTIEPALVDRVIDQLCTTRAGLVRQGTGATQSDGDRIETPYLQLVMTRLWTEEQRQGSPILRTKTLAALGDTTAIVATYLDDIMKALSEEEQALAARRF